MRTITFPSRRSLTSVTRYGFLRRDIRRKSMLSDPYVDCHVALSTNTKKWWAAENATSSLSLDKLNGLSIKALTTFTVRPFTDLGGPRRQLNQSSGRRKFESPSQLAARASERIPLAHQPMQRSAISLLTARLVVLNKHAPFGRAMTYSRIRRINGLSPILLTGGGELDTVWLHPEVRQQHSDASKSTAKLRARSE